MIWRISFNPIVFKTSKILSVMYNTMRTILNETFYIPIFKITPPKSVWPFYIYNISQSRPTTVQALKSVIVLCIL